MTYWKIQVYYYLKGNQESIDLFVVTPGAENKSPQTSLDFRLDQWGKTVILFLREREGTFEPLSPQGIINLDKTDYIHEVDEPVDGKLILKEFQFDRKNNYELEKFILDDSSIKTPRNVLSSQKVLEKGSNSPLGAGSIVLMTFTLAVISAIKKYSKV